MSTIFNYSLRDHAKTLLADRPDLMYYWISLIKETFTVSEAVFPELYEMPICKAFSVNKMEGLSPEMRSLFPPELYVLISVNNQPVIEMLEEKYINPTSPII